MNPQSQPQRKPQQSIHGRLGRMVGLPPEDEAAPEPKPTLETTARPEALYESLIAKFTTVEEPPAVAVLTPEPVLTPGESAEAKHEAEYRGRINQLYNELGVPFPEEIRKAVRRAYASRGFSPSRRDRVLITQHINIAMWKAIINYRRMNPALAYVIALNQANAFLNMQWKDQTTPVMTMEPALDESGQPILKRNGQPKRKRVPALDEFGKAKRAYPDSFDDKGVDRDGFNQMSRAERQVVMSTPPPEMDDPRLDTLYPCLPALRRMVSGWHGAKRIVGEVLLTTPDASVREFPGVPKSTASVVLKVVKAEFRALLKENEEKLDSADSTRIYPLEENGGPIPGFLGWR
jgi:hypothetical protein